MSRSNIPEGYALAIKSWENDGDCYKTQTFYGLGPYEVKFLVALAKLFRSMNSGPGKGFGGGAWHWEGGEEKWKADVMAAYDKVVKKFTPKLSAEFLKKWAVEPLEGREDPDCLFDGYNECIDQLVSFPEDDCYHGGNYIRVYDSHTVHYYETEVSDVTKEFK